jgi:hypothetical protein
VSVKQLLVFLAIEMIVIAGLLMVALDLRAHTRVEELAGVNVWGYRGPVARHKQPNEIRVVIVGGTRAFGWGEPASALPSVLRQIVMLTTDRPGHELRPVVVINLARLGALADTYPATLDRYGYLNPDYVCVYDDLGVRGAEFVAHPSGVSVLTGYAPILPLVFREKGMVWRFGGVAAGYASPTSSIPAGTSVLRALAGRALMQAGAALAAADRTAANVMVRGIGHASEDQDATAYADQMLAAVQSAHHRARGVVLVVSPAETPRQAERRNALTSRLRQGGSMPWLRIVDLGADHSLAGAAMRIDGWNYSSDGLTRSAVLIAPALVELIVAASPP